MEMTQNTIPVVPVEKKMMNLTLHVQRDEEVQLVRDVLQLELQRGPEGVYIGRGDDGLASAVQEVISKVTQLKYQHVLVGGCTGLVAGIVANLMKSGMDVALYEFESDKKRDATGRMSFKHFAIRRIF